MATTSPDGIGYITTADNVTPSVESSAQATTIQTAFNFRQRYEFVWANAAARTTQTGMVTGSTGYQIDTKSEYIYESSAWRLKLPYAEFSSPSAAIPVTTYTSIGTLTINSSTSSSTTFTTASINIITLVDPGIYSISAFYFDPGGNAWGAASHVALYAGNTVTGAPASVGYFSSGSYSPLALPFYRTTSSNQTISFWAFNTSAGSKNVQGTVRIGRLG